MLQVDELRGSPMSVGSLEEIIDERCAPNSPSVHFCDSGNDWAALLPHAIAPQQGYWLYIRSHAIVSTLVGPEYYVNIMSFVDKGQLEPGCSILLHNKARAPASCICCTPASSPQRKDLFCSDLRLPCLVTLISSSS